MSRRKMLVADLLCGAGGSSTGCARALRELGIKMELVCVNHWPVAIETHKRNHPEARHYVQDISTVRPHLIVPEGYLDLLMASPTCTYHSVARGGKPTSDQQRSDPWHIITWFTELRVKRAIIENVWEFTSWGPVDARTGKPIKARKGEYHRAWIDTIWKLGATSLEWRKLNSANYGDATTRSRYILKLRFDRVQVGWAPLTHAKRSDDLLLFPSLKPWRPAREIIDWSIKGKSIFTRKKPLAPKTLARIYAGAVKFHWPEPFLVILRNHMGAQSVNSPVPAIAANGTHIGLAQPIVLANRNNNTAKGTDESPIPCLTTAPGGGIAIAAPIIVSARHGKEGAGPRPREVSEPLPTITAGGSQVALAEPVIVNGRKGNQPKGVSTDPVPTLDTKGGVWLTEPVIVRTNMHGRKSPGARGAEDPLMTITTDGGIAIAEPFVLSQQNSGSPRGADEPLPTITTGGAGVEEHPGCARPMLIEPFILSRQGEGAPRPVEEPTPTQVAKHSHVLIAPYYGSGSGETCSSAEEPLPTIPTRDRFGMVVPVTNGSGGPGPRDIDDPVPTITTAKGGEFAIVVPVTHEGGLDRVLDANADPLSTITGANRGELAFIAAQFGERKGQAPRVHDIGEPSPSPCATGHINLVEATPQYDILFRMLEPHELAAAMGFNDEEVAYEFAGTKTEQIKQIGNAVSVAMMKAEVKAIMADAARPARASRARQDRPTRVAA